MFWFKACPRCRGDLFIEEDADSRDVVCLQCGYRMSYTQREPHTVLAGSQDRVRVPERPVASVVGGHW